MRWELRPRLFLRTSEFLWQEGHTAHATMQDARDYALRILHEAYEDLMVSVLAIPVLVGRKTAQERFVGAVNTLCCEGARSGEGTPPGAALTEEERDVAEVRGGRRTKTIQDIVNTATEQGTEAGGREQGPE